MQVVVTEKPSVARDLAKVLGAQGRGEGFLEGNGLRITWCFGHMAEHQDPVFYNADWKRWDPEHLPMLPEEFGLKVREGAKDQFKVLKRLLTSKETTSIVNACDAGREGELIFRYVAQLAGVKKTPIQRLWVSSMTDKALRQAWKTLQEGGRFDGLADAARCRAEADWLVGLNATRAMTCLARRGGGQGRVLSVGRVQTPTLAMIVKRDAEIAAFVAEDFWQVRATFAAHDVVADLPSGGEGAGGEGAGGEAAEGRSAPEERVSESFVATWFQAGGVSIEPVEGAAADTPAAGGADGRAGARAAGSDDDEGDDPRGDGPTRTTRLPSAALAEAVAAATRGQVGTIGTAERRRTRERPPLLYDLTALQRRANQRYGFGADRTLQVAQALYEKHKLITYPRTDARYLTDDQVGELPGIVEAVGRLSVYAPFASAVLEAGPIRPGKRVIDASEVGDHHAILPTTRTPDPRRLSADEKRIYDLVTRRFLAALSPVALFDVALILVEVPPGPDAALPPEVRAPLTFRARGRICVDPGWQAVDPPRKRKDRVLPQLDEGATVQGDPVKVQPGQTRPPRPHDDASILKAMETAGRELDDAALKRAMRQSGLGTPATRASILNVLLKRGFVERNKRALLATDRGRSLIAAVPVDELKSAELTGRWEARLSAIAEGRDQRDDFMAAVRARTGDIVAAILAAEPPPAEDIEDDREVLGACPVCGTPVRETPAVYSCQKGRACTFVIFKKVARRAVSKRAVKQLLTEGRTPVLKRFKSKAGKDFEAALTLDEEGKVVFDFPPRAPRPGPPPNLGPVGTPCPTCGEGQVIRGRAAFGCSRWRAGCGWRQPFTGQ
jgi:DNA topoisomerase III